VLYVGKAKSLRARVKSYFHAEGKARRIAEEATALDFIATRDEVEALLLEANLIKAHRPPYNVLLKDDKHYPFLKLTNEPFPTLLVVRRVEEETGPGTTGPSPRPGALRRIKALVDRLFPLRKNSGYPMKRRRYPCLNHSMGRCLAPCVGLADPKAYQEVVRQVEAVLEGRVDGLLAELAAKMREAARRLEF
jgi:excinuclease ABC subunit C